MRSLAEMNNLVSRLWEERAKKDALVEQMKAQQMQIDKLEKEITRELQEQGLETFRASVGTVTIATKFSVKYPTDPDQEQAFLEYLKQDGADHLRKVNYQTLNAYYKTKLDAAKERGEYLDVPGLQPTSDNYLMFRKGGNQ